MRLGKKIIRPTLILSFIFITGCRGNSDGTIEFPTGKYCFFSGKEAFFVNNGFLSSYRKNINGVKVRVMIGAKTGDRFIFPQDDIAVAFDEKGEYLEKKETSITFWPFDKKNDINSDVRVYFTKPDGSYGEVLFRPESCSKTLPSNLKIGSSETSGAAHGSYLA